MLRSRHRFASVAVSMLFLVSACQTAAPSKPTTPTVLRVGSATEALSLDPMVDVGGNTQRMLGNIFSALVVADDNFKQVGDLAESWQFIAPASWEFKLRKGVKFHSGDELTSADVKYSYDRILDPANKSGMAALLSSLATVEAVDPYTVRFTNKQADATFPEITKAIGIVPRKIVESYGLQRFGKEPVGTGPYKFVEWVKDDHLSLQANKDYFKGPPKIDQLAFRPIPEESTRVAALLSDQVDMIAAVAAQYLAQIKGRSDLKLVAIPGARTNEIIMDTSVAPLTDVRVRQAINYAIDYESLVKDVMGGQAVVNGQPIAPTIFGFDPNLKVYSYDPQKAKQLLADAGYANGFSLEFRGPIGDTPNDKELQQAVVGMLSKVGINLNYQGMEFGAWLVGYRARTWPMTWHTNANPILDADQIFGTFYLSTGRGYYKSPEMDKLVIASRAEMDPAKRLPLLRAIIKKGIDDAMWVNMLIANANWAMKKNLNFTPRSDEFVVMDRASWSP